MNSQTLVEKSHYIRSVIFLSHIADTQCIAVLSQSRVFSGRNSQGSTFSCRIGCVKRIDRRQLTHTSELLQLVKKRNETEARDGRGVLF